MIFPDVVVLLPGIAGSVLQRNGSDVWALSPQALLSGVRRLGRSILQLELKNDNPQDIELDDGITAPRLMPDLHLLPGLDWKIDGYGSVARHLVGRLQLVEGENFFPFPYDWRRDNRASARRLARQSGQWLQRWRTRSGNDGARLILVAHSMGGLVARYFIECLGGWRDTRMLITIGTPFYGSLNAVDFLANEMKRGIWPFTLDLTPLLRTFTSVHQLVPVYKCVQAGDAPATSPADAPIPGWDAAWRDNLNAFYREMEDQAARNRDERDWETMGTHFVPIVGTDQPTNQSAVVTSGGRVEVLRTLGGRDGGGDGTVPRISAALAGTQQTRMFTPERHASLQNIAAVLGHVAGVLGSLDEPTIDDVRRGLIGWFSFDGRDVYSTDEPPRFDVALVSDLAESRFPELVATVTVTNRDTGEVVRQQEWAVQRQHITFDVGSLPAGVYGIEVAPPPQTDVASVRDVFVVLDPNEELLEE